MNTYFLFDRTTIDCESMSSRKKDKTPKQQTPAMDEQEKKKNEKDEQDEDEDEEEEEEKESQKQKKQSESIDYEKIFDGVKKALLLSGPSAQSSREVDLLTESFKKHLIDMEKQIAAVSKELAESKSSSDSRIASLEKTVEDLRKQASKASTAKTTISYGYEATETENEEFEYLLSNTLQIKGTGPTRTSREKAKKFGFTEFIPPVVTGDTADKAEFKMQELGHQPKSEPPVDAYGLIQLLKNFQQFSGVSMDATAQGNSSWFLLFRRQHPTLAEHLEGSAKFSPATTFYEAMGLIASIQLAMYDSAWHTNPHMLITKKQQGQMSWPQFTRETVGAVRALCSWGIMVSADKLAKALIDNACHLYRAKIGDRITVDDIIIKGNTLSLKPPFPEWMSERALKQRSERNSKRDDKQDDKRDDKRDDRRSDKREERRDGARRDTKESDKKPGTSVKKENDSMSIRDSEFVIVQMTANGKPVRVKLDSGSNVSMVSETWLRDNNMFWGKEKVVVTFSSDHTITASKVVDPITLVYGHISFTEPEVAVSQTKIDRGYDYWLGVGTMHAMDMWSVGHAEGLKKRQQSLSATPSQPVPSQPDSSAREQAKELIGITTQEGRIVDMTQPSESCLEAVAENANMPKDNPSKADPFVVELDNEPSSPEEFK